MKATVVTQEPYGSYHLKPLLNIKDINLTHLQPYPRERSSFIKTSDSLLTVDNSSMLIVTGGLTTDFTESVMSYARSIGLPIVFLELAYPASHSVHRPQVKPDLILSTTNAGLEAYRNFFQANNETRIKRIEHPLLWNLPTLDASVKPSLLIGTSVSRELPDGGISLVRLTHELSKNENISIVVKLHPREDSKLWSDFCISSKSDLSENLKTAWGFIAYQTTGFLVSNKMDVPTYHIAEEDWMSTLLPKNYANSTAVTLKELKRITLRKPSPLHVHESRNLSEATFLEHLKNILK